MLNSFSLSALKMITLALLTWPSPALGEGPKAKTQLDFDEGLIEGVNKRPLDSLRQTSEQSKDASAHLYQKRVDFEDRTRQMLQELGMR